MAQTKKHPLDGYDHTATVPRGTPLVVSDRVGATWKLSKKGIRFHADDPSVIRGAKPCRPPVEFAASRALRAVRDDVLRSGDRGPVPAAAAGTSTTVWTDRVPGRHDVNPRLEVRSDGVFVAVRPVYDDAPTVAWRRATPAESKAVAEALAVAPEGAHLPVVDVRERTVRVDRDDARHEAAAALPGARPMYVGGPIEVPVTAWRRLVGI